MGKASKQVLEAVNDIYKEELTDPHSEDENVEDDIDHLEKLYDNIEEVTMNIKSFLIEYCKDNGVHMCEFLDLENVENYIMLISTMYKF